MNLDQYVEQQKDELETFASWWRLKRARNPKRFPIYLSPEEWAEHFREFTTVRTNTKEQHEA